MGDGVIEVGEDVVFGRDVVEGSQGTQEPFVFGSWTLQQDRDVALFEVGDDLPEGLGAGGVEHLEVGEAQDHDADVGDLARVR